MGSFGNTVMIATGPSVVFWMNSGVAISFAWPWGIT